MAHPQVIYSQIIHSLKATMSTSNQPIYSRLWDQFKQFPTGLHQGADRAPETSGAAAAALLSGGIGAVSMMLTHHYAELSKANNQFVIWLGSWIPGALNPDPMWGNLENYAGKEMMFFVGWWVSWAVLYPLLKHRQVKPRTLILGLLSLFTIATAMAWHPLFPYLSLQ
jgi:hypothetical protein